MQIGNFYKNPQILTDALLKSKLHPFSILIKPITYSDFIDPNNSKVIIDSKTAKNLEKTAFLFQVLHVGDQVTRAAPGEFIIPSSAAVDVLSPDAKHLLIQEEDVRVTLTAADLSPTT